MVWMMAAAWAEDARCPAGLAPALTCARYGSYASVCVGPDPAAPAKAQIVVGPVGEPPTFAVPADASLGAFGRSADGMSLVARQGDTAARLERDGAAYATFTTRRGSAVTRLDCSASDVALDGLLAAVKVDPTAETSLGSPPPPPSACADSLLSCPVGPKVLALCGTPSSLRYVFGPPGKPELVHPDAANAAPFRVSRDQHAHTHATTVRFDRGGFTYEVWSAEVDSGCCGDLPSAGVRVVQGGVTKADLPCTGPPDGSLDDLPVR